MPDSDSPTPNQSRQDQGKFDQDQINFLKTFLDAYKACGEELAMKGSGAKGLKGVKGNKKEWVLKRCIQPMWSALMPLQWRARTFNLLKK
jgi:hypothetical protein